MSNKLNYLECWTTVATSLLAQALAGEPVLAESLPKPISAQLFAFVATVTGEETGRFVVMLDGGLLESPLLGEGVDQKAAWGELLKEIADAAAGELFAKTGRKAQVASFAEAQAESKLTRAFQLSAGERSWSIQVRDEVKLVERRVGDAVTPATIPGESAAGSGKAGKNAKPAGGSAPPIAASLPGAQSIPGSQAGPAAAAPPRAAAQSPLQPSAQSSSGLSPGLELLLDVELEASLRFGAREMPLGEILDLGPGDVVQLDRHISDPVDLIVGDKIVARGEVVLVNGNFGLRVTEVAEPQRRLESIRCLF